MSRMTTEWELPGAEGEPILGVTDECAAEAAASVVLLHGHKGYYDYGFLPVMTDRLVRQFPVCVHRYNASHSGMIRATETFEKPELFARDTWNKQVHDLRTVVRAARTGDLPGTSAGKPVIAVGHSRGGTTCLLSAGRAGDPAEKPDAIVSLAAPCFCVSDRDEKRRAFDTDGRLESPSGRTGQALWIDPVWLDEQDADPPAHDVPGLCRSIDIPTLVVHGDEDATIDPASARQIAEAVAGAECVLVVGGTHVFNTPNPAKIGADLGPELDCLMTAVEGFMKRVLA